MAISAEPPVASMVEPWLEAVDKPGGEGLQWNVFRLSRRSEERRVGKEC